MARRIWLSLLALLVALCIGLSLLAVAAVVVLLVSNNAVPVNVIPVP